MCYTEVFYKGTEYMVNRNIGKDVCIIKDVCTLKDNRCTMCLSDGIFVSVSNFRTFTVLIEIIHFHLSCLFLKVIKSVCSGSGSSLSGVSQRSVGAKEMHYVLRVLGPAACRSPALFSELSKEIMRVALPPPSKRGNR